MKLCGSRTPREVVFNFFRICWQRQSLCVCVNQWWRKDLSQLRKRSASPDIQSSRCVYNTDKVSQPTLYLCRALSYWCLSKNMYITYLFFKSPKHLSGRTLHVPWSWTREWCSLVSMRHSRYPTMKFLFWPPQLSTWLIEPMYFKEVVQDAAWDPLPTSTAWDSWSGVE